MYVEKKRNIFSWEETTKNKKDKEDLEKSEFYEGTEGIMMPKKKEELIYREHMSDIHWRDLRRKERFLQQNVNKKIGNKENPKIETQLAA